MAGGGAWSWRDQGLILSDGGQLAPSMGMAIVLSDQTNTCAFSTYMINNQYKANEHAMVIIVTVSGTALPAPGTYATADV